MSTFVKIIVMPKSISHVNAQVKMSVKPKTTANAEPDV